VRTLRARLVASVLAIVAVVLVAYSALLGTVRREQATTQLQRQVLEEADLAVRLLGQATVLPSESDSARPATREFLRATLEGFPGWLVVLDDSGRASYASFAVRQLGQDDLAALLSASVQLSEARPAVKVRLSQEQLLIVSRTVPQAPGGRSRRVVAGATTKSLDFAPPELVTPMLVVGTLLLGIAAGLAWLAAGRAVRPVARLRADAEAITDGRSLHRRLWVPEGADPVADEVARLAVTLNDMIERLESSFAALRRFTADASHELKTPLTVLRADIERAMAAPGAVADQLVHLEEALAETTRMADLVDGLLTLARADEGRFDVVREPVPLEPLVRDVFETALILGESAEVSVSLPIVEPGTVFGDVQRLRQLLLNLVTNAIKYTPAGGTVELTLSRRVDGIAVSVKDTGIGIAAADLPFVFDRFWRADRARTRGGERGGTGLGLAISQWIAQAHGGALIAQSRLGRGSTFTVTLPLAPDTASNESLPQRVGYAPHLGG
jgi:two-component system, OmpR family, sensor kinase